ncbi:MAG: hypothetical protein L0338_38095 [Acidobacteria bacterium]|nr:hypothetical protein [Acidobacteriota bacterium]
MDSLLVADFLTNSMRSLGVAFSAYNGGLSSVWKDRQLVYTEAANVSPCVAGHPVTP